MKKTILSLVAVSFICMLYSQNTPHILSDNNGVDLNESNNYNGAVIKSYISGKPLDKGASLSFVLSANSDKQNMWSLGRIIVLPDNQNNYNADGKMILGTRRYFDKYASGSQWYFGDDLTINSQGSIGIGTTNPQSKFHILGNQNTTLRIQSSTNGFGNARIEFYSDPIGDIHEWRPGYIVSEDTDSRNFTGRLSFYTNGSGYSNRIGSIHAMSLTNGKVGIGTLNPDEKLTVKGNIHAQEVKVDLQVPADYVFQHYYTGTSSLNNEYRFPTLQETEQFIKENHHLPQIPSARQIQEQGLKVGEMTNLLLQKIEELTLYSIEQNKNLLEQENKYKILQSELQKQQEKITYLENLLLKN